MSSQFSLCIHKFVKRPFGEFYDHIVKGRFKAGSGLSGDFISDFIQTISNGDFCSHSCNGIAGGFGSQGGRAGYAGIYFNNRIFKAFRIQGKLTVAPTLNTHGIYNIQSRTAQHLVFSVCKRYRRSNDDGISGVNAYGIKIFHRADRNTVSGSVPNYFKFNFFPPGNTFFYKNLCDGRLPETVFCNLFQFFFV